ALEELAIVAQAAPNDPSVHLNMAFAYGGLKKIPEAEREFHTAMRLNPQFDTALDQYVAMLFGLNQAPKAVETAKQYATANPNRAAAQFIYAQALANTRKLDEAIPEYKQAAPDAVSINDTLGWIQYKKGNYVLAVSLLTEVVNKIPENADYHYHFGMALN